MGCLRAADIGRRFDFAQKETPAAGKTDCWRDRGG